MGVVYHTVTNSAGSAAATTGVFSLDWMAMPFEASVSVQNVTGTLTAGGTVQVTPDDVNAATATSFSQGAFPPALVGKSTVWYTVPGTMSATGGFWNLNEIAAGSTAFPLPVRFVQVTGTLSAGGSFVVAIVQSDNQRAG